MSKISYNRKYYLEHRDEMITYAKQYYKEHREKYISYHKKYFQDYYLQNKDKIKERQRQYRESKKQGRPPKQPKAKKQVESLPAQREVPLALPTTIIEAPQVIPTCTIERGSFQVSFD